jgi:hypothetical protein
MKTPSHVLELTPKNVMAYLKSHRGDKFSSLRLSQIFKCRAEHMRTVIELIDDCDLRFEAGSKAFLYFVVDAQAKTQDPQSMITRPRDRGIVPRNERCKELYPDEDREHHTAIGKSHDYRDLGD